MSADPASLDLLVAEARRGSQDAWNRIVDQYAQLVWSICCGFRLTEAEAAEVSRTVWQRTVVHLPLLHQPAALPGWLATITRHQCVRVLISERGGLCSDVPRASAS